MTAVTAKGAAVVPDKVTPEVGWRFWKMDRGRLCSITRAELWPPVQPLVAKCKIEGSTAMHVHVRGVPIEIGWEVEGPRGERISVHGLTFRTFSAYYTGSPPVPPRTVLPPGYEWRSVWRQLFEEAHVAPDPNCSCGIYAANDPLTALEYHGEVMGRVHLWGTVVPGDKGWRAQYAYPAELYVLGNRRKIGPWFSRRPVVFDSRLVPLLTSRYGVPVHTVESFDVVDAL